LRWREPSFSTREATADEWFIVTIRNVSLPTSARHEFPFLASPRAAEYPDSSAVDHDLTTASPSVVSRRLDERCIAGHLTDPRIEFAKLYLPRRVIGGGVVQENIYLTPKVAKVRGHAAMDLSTLAEIKECLKRHQNGGQEANDYNS
jgi:hypothetical protein